MKRFLLALMLACALQSVAFARGRREPANAARPAAVALEAPATTTSASGMIYAQEQIVTLPRDAERPYLTVFGNTSQAQVRRLDDMFRNHPGLSKLTNQCHYKLIATNGPMNLSRYKIGDGPVVRLQLADGTVVTELAGNAIPLTAEALTRALNGKAAECLLRRRNRQSQPGPQPPVIETDPPAQPLDDYEPLTEPTPGFPWLLLGLTVASGLAIGGIWGWKAQYAESA